MKAQYWLTALAAATAAAPALAGPPYLTDDPVATDTGHWEIYGFTAGEGRGSIFDDDTGFDFNYGPVKDVQLTATLPLSFSHAPLEGWREGTGEVELAVKYRVIHDEHSGFSAAIFPRAILPTASRSPDEKTRLLLPLWLEQDFSAGTSIFGGGGYEVNPGPGNRSFWQAGVAVTQDLSRKLTVGAEMTRQGPDSVGGTAQTRAGAGVIVQLSKHYALLFSAGPTWADHRTECHFYAALGLNF
jgi:hypothetical protein